MGKTFYEFLCEELNDIRRIEPSYSDVFASSFILFTVTVYKHKRNEIDQEEFLKCIQKLYLFHKGVQTDQIKLLNLRKFKRYRITQKELQRKDQEDRGDVFFSEKRWDRHANHATIGDHSISSPAEVSAKRA